MCFRSRNHVLRHVGSPNHKGDNLVIIAENYLNFSIESNVESLPLGLLHPRRLSL